MTTQLKNFAVLFADNGNEYEKLIGANNDREASETYSQLFPDSKVMGVRKCTKEDSGKFFRGLKKVFN